MTKTDVLVQKDQEIKRLNDQILNLTEKLANLQISLGSKDEVLRSEKKRLEKELELAKEEQRVIIKSSSNTATKKQYICNNCGYITSASHTYGCPSCGSRNGYTLVSPATDKIEYKNLDVELAEIKKTVEKQMKKSVADLENTQLDLEIKIESLENELKRKDKKHNAEVDDLQTKNLERINKYREEIKELEQKIVDIKKDKTEEQLEAKRKEEVEKLKAANAKLIERVVEAEKLGFWTRLVNKLFGKMLRREAVRDILEASELNKTLENAREVRWNRLRQKGVSGYVTPYGWVVSEGPTSVYGW